MNLLDADGKYVDVLELGLYNGTLSGVSLSGKEFSTRTRWRVGVALRW